HAKWYKEPLVRASKEGHEIGNHTFNHPDISNLSSSQIEEEIVTCDVICLQEVLYPQFLALKAVLNMDGVFATNVKKVNMIYGICT
ncbi:polysaccharide deacetylase family protein, partial [Clostridioides difficile]